MYNICTYLQKCTTPGRESDARKTNKADRFLPICVHIVRIWLVSLRATCRLGFCLVYTFNASTLPMPHSRDEVCGSRVISQLWWRRSCPESGRTESDDHCLLLCIELEFLSAEKRSTDTPQFTISKRGTIYQIQSLATNFLPPHRSVQAAVGTIWNRHRRSKHRRRRRQLQWVAQWKTGRRRHFLLLLYCLATANIICGEVSKQMSSLYVGLDVACLFEAGLCESDVQPFFLKC